MACFLSPKGTRAVVLVTHLGYLKPLKYVLYPSILVAVLRIPRRDTRLSPQLPLSGLPPPYSSPLLQPLKYK